MKDYLKTALLAALVASLVSVLGFWLVGGINQPNLGASGTRFPNGVSADSTSPVAGEVRGTTLTVTSTQTLTGTTTLSSGHTVQNSADIFFKSESVTNSSTASSTICTERNPWNGTASSTITRLVVNITAGTSTARTFEVATSTSPAATTTASTLATFSLPANTQQHFSFSLSGLVGINDFVVVRQVQATNIGTDTGSCAYGFLTP